MNSVNIMGRLVDDVELKDTNSGKKVCNFRIAVDAGKDKQAYFFPIVAWNGTAENIAKFFHKGSKIALSGILMQRSYIGEDEQKHNVIEILANSFDFCDSKKAEQGGGISSNEQPPETPVVIQTEAAAAGLPFEV